MYTFLVQPWLQFKHDIVRQLAFCIASPPLLQSWPQESHTHIDLPDQQFWLKHFQHYLPRLTMLDNNPAPLEQYLHTLRSTRLGIRFESLLGFWLQDSHYHSYQLLGQSIKRMDGKRTLGELDFLVLNQQNNQVEHWEVAIKFYLGEHSFFTPEGVADSWVGLNRRDTLGRKLLHLCNHQFNVHAANGFKIDKQCAIVKGRLFYPVHQQITTPHWIAASHLQGEWGFYPPGMHSQDFWRRAQRLEWLSESAQAQHPAQSPRYWTDGLYFLMQNDMVKRHYMLRTHNLIHKYT